MTRITSFLVSRTDRGVGPVCCKDNQKHTTASEIVNPAGAIRTTWWDAGDLPSGVYFVTLRAGGELKSRRIVVAK